jgi:hypothetical protein
MTKSQETALRKICKKAGFNVAITNVLVEIHKGLERTYAGYIKALRQENVELKRQLRDAAFYTMRMK